ncbi:hypothetical protein NF212_12685 [Parasalinivibrio latis]|uniref:hypothetical protein n=1 Tax=Parasalinivibrio latis TaxID=2952610 RepID=UPI0030E30EE0
MWDDGLPEKASFKTILEHMQKGDILALKQDQSDIYLILEEETRCLRQNRQDLEIEPGDTSDESSGFSFNVERFRFAGRLRYLKQYKEQMCGRLAYLYLTQSDGLFIFGEVPHLQSRDHVKVDARKLP